MKVSDNHGHTAENRQPAAENAGCQQPESVELVAQEIREHLDELGLDKHAHTWVQGPCYSLAHGYSLKEWDHDPLAILEDGNELAREYARRLRHAMHGGERGESQTVAATTEPDAGRGPVDSAGDDSQLKPVPAPAVQANDDTAARDGTTSKQAPRPREGDVGVRNPETDDSTVSAPSTPPALTTVSDGETTAPAGAEDALIALLSELYGCVGDLHLTQATQKTVLEVCRGVKNDGRLPDKQRLTSIVPMLQHRTVHSKVWGWRLARQLGVKCEWTPKDGVETIYALLPARIGPSQVRREFGFAGRPRDFVIGHIETIHRARSEERVIETAAKLARRLQYGNPRARELARRIRRATAAGRKPHAPPPSDEHAQPANGVRLPASDTSMAEPLPKPMEPDNCIEPEEGGPQEAERRDHPVTVENAKPTIRTVNVQPTLARKVEKAPVPDEPALRTSKPSHTLTGQLVLFTPTRLGPTPCPTEGADSPGPEPAGNRDQSPVLDKLASLVQQVETGIKKLGLRGTAVGAALKRCSVVVADGDRTDRLQAADALAAMLKKGNDKAKAFASQILDCLQPPLPGFEDDVGLPPGVGTKQGAPIDAASTRYNSPTLVPLGDIKVAPPFCELFPIADSTLAAIASDMAEKGYDAAQPIVVWAGKGIVIDGHTRLTAAKKAGLQEVPVVEREFGGDEEGLVYAIHAQRDRRNLTDADILHLVEQLDKRHQRGGDRRSAEARSNATRGAIDRSSEKTAKLIGVSSRTVERVRAVLDSGKPELRKAVESGEKSISKAAREAQAAKPKRKSKGGGKNPTPKPTKVEMTRSLGEVLRKLKGAQEALLDGDVFTRIGRGISKLIKEVEKQLGSG